MSYYRSINNVIKALLLVLMIRSQVQSQNLQVPASESPVSSESGVVIEAAVVLQELTNGNAERIPERLLAEASAIAIVPHYMQGAFVIGISGGRGVVVTRNSNGNWMAPEFITIGGGSVGWQIGVQSVDLVLVFRTPRSLANLRQGKVTLGANASRNFDVFSKSWFICWSFTERCIIATGQSSYSELLSDGTRFIWGCTSISPSPSQRNRSVLCRSTTTTITTTTACK